MPDTILIRGLETWSVIGTLPEERLRRQKLIFNLEINVDMRAAGASDDLNDSVNYSEVETAVKNMAENTQFFLLEKMAQAAADCVLSFDKVTGVTVTVDKPGAAYCAKSIAVRICRRKEEI